jgi:hypothetical protein
MKRIIAVCCLAFTTSLVEGAIQSQLVLKDNPRALEVLVLRTSKTVKLPSSTKTRGALAEFAKEQNSPIAFHDSKDGMLGFVGASNLSFLKKDVSRTLRTMKSKDVQAQMTKMMETEDFVKKYAVKNRPKWPSVGVKMPGEIQAVFLESKTSKYLGIDSVDTMYILELGTLSMKKDGIKLKVHTSNAFVKDQGMHSVNHRGYPGAFYLYPREEWSRKLMPDGSVSHKEMMGMFKSRKSPVLYFDDDNDGKFGVVGSKQIMFITSTAFTKVTAPKRAARRTQKTKEGYKYESVFNQAKFAPPEEYKKKYELISGIKPPYPQIPIQVDKHIQFVFLKNKPSDYLMIRTFDDKTFVVKIVKHEIADSADVFRGKKGGIRFKVFEIE